jgi:hypothetical protein
MNKRHKRLSYKQAKHIVITYVQAFLTPFESADSEEVKSYFPLIPIVQGFPHADINALCDLDEIFENFSDFNL